MNNDPMERDFAEACAKMNLEAVPDRETGLDYYLPAFDVYVELKQFHSPRISEQMSRRPNVIAIQGRRALATFIALLQVGQGVS